MKSIILLSFLLNIHLSFAAQAWEPEAKTGAWLTHHEQLLSVTKQHKNDIKVVFLGDSITEGWNWQGKAIWDKYYAPRGAYNYGISGDTTQNVLWRIQNHEFDGINPKVLVLKIGTNNIGDTEEHIALGVKEIVTELRAKLPNTKILLLAVLPRLPVNLDNKVHRLNPLIAKNADNSHVFFLDMGPQFETSPGVEKPGLYVQDGLHLDTKGYQVWYETMEPLFKKLLG